MIVLLLKESTEHIAGKCQKETNTHAVIKYVWNPVDINIVFGLNRFLTGTITT